jgi:dihydroxyacetone kinase-like predicted kinase
VIPTRAQVQGLAAIAVHDPSRSFDDDVVHMTAAAGHARHGAVTVAARDAMTTAGPCRAGDALGVVEGDFAVVGDDLYATAVTVVDRLLIGGGELVTIVRGSEGSGDLAERLHEYVEQSYAGVDAAVLDGGQARYPLLIGVE